MPTLELERELATKAGRMAARLGRSLAECPYDPDGDPRNRVLTLAFVRGWRSATAATKSADVSGAEATRDLKRLSGQHNQQDHAGTSSINAIAGIEVLEGGGSKRMSGRRVRVKHQPTPGDLTAALATLRGLRPRLRGTKLRELDDIITALTAIQLFPDEERPKHLSGLHDQSSHGRRRTGVLGSVLDKLGSLRENLSDDDRSVLDRAMAQLQGLESSDVDDDDLIEDEPDEDDDEDEGSDDLVMESANGDLTFTPYLSGEVDVDWEDGSIRFTPQQAREVTAAVTEFAALPVVDAPEMPEWEVPDTIATQDEYIAWRRAKLNEWYKSSAWDARNAVLGEMTTSDGELKVSRGAGGTIQIGDPDTVDDPEGEGLLHLDDPHESRVFVDFLRIAMGQAGSAVDGKGVKRTYIRDDEGQFAETPGGSSALDKLKLAPRIQLGEGEKLLSSRKFKSTDDFSSYDLLAAEVESPSGREVRLGIIDRDNSKQWRAAPPSPEAARRHAQLNVQLEDMDEDDPAYEEVWKERNALEGEVLGGDTTAIVSPTSIGAMHAELAAGVEDAKRWAREFDRFWAENPDPSQAEIDAMGDPDRDLMAGSVPVDNGRTLHYRIVADGEEPPSTWRAEFGVRPSDADEDWSIGSQDDAARFAEKDIKALLAGLAELAGGQTKAATGRRLSIKRSSTGETMQLKSFQPEVKAVGKDGTATIAIATFNVVDKDGDVTLPGYFGEQHAQMVPVHDWNHVPIGKGRVYERGNQALVDVKFNLDIQAAKDWYAAIKFDKENPPSLQQYSYGFEVLEGGSKQGNFKGRAVRYLTPRPDGTAGSKVFEFSPVLLGAGEGTGTVDVKSLARERIAARKARTGTIGLYQGGVAPHETATVARSWDGVKTVAGLPDDALPSHLRTVYAWVDPAGDPELKASYKFPHHHGVSGPANIRACLAGIAALNGATGGTDLSEADRKSVYDHLASHLKDADREPPALRTDVGIPSGKNLRFGDEAANVLAGVAGLIDRASDVMALRRTKGKGLTANTADLLSWVRDECKRLDSLLSQPIEADDEPSTHMTDEEIASVVLAAVARLQDDN